MEIRGCTDASPPGTRKNRYCPTMCAMAANFPRWELPKTECCVGPRGAARILQYGQDPGARRRLLASSTTVLIWWLARVSGAFAQGVIGFLQKHWEQRQFCNASDQSLAKGPAAIYLSVVNLRVIHPLKTGAYCPWSTRSVHKCLGNNEWRSSRRGSDQSTESILKPRRQFHCPGGVN